MTFSLFQPKWFYDKEDSDLQVNEKNFKYVICLYSDSQLLIKFSLKKQWRDLQLGLPRVYHVWSKTRNKPFLVK